MNRFLDRCTYTKPKNGGVILSCKNGNSCNLVGERYGGAGGREHYCYEHFTTGLGRSEKYKDGVTAPYKGFYRIYYYTDENGVSYQYNYGTLCNPNHKKPNDFDFTPRPPIIGDSLYIPEYGGYYRHTSDPIIYVGETPPIYPKALIDFFTKAYNLKRNIVFLKKLTQSISSASTFIGELSQMGLDRDAKTDGETDWDKFLNIFACFDITATDAMRKATNIVSLIKQELIYTLNQDRPFAKKDNGKMAGEEYYHPLNAFWENGDKKGIYRSLDFERERFYQRGVGGSKFSLFNCYEISNGIK